MSGKDLQNEYRRDLRADYEYEKHARLDDPGDSDDWKPGQFDTRDEMDEYYGRDMRNRIEINRLLNRARSLEAMAKRQHTQIDEGFLQRMADEAREEAAALERDERDDAE
jgi:hypothetical protein